MTHSLNESSNAFSRLPPLHQETMDSTVNESIARSALEEPLPTTLSVVTFEEKIQDDDDDDDDDDSIPSLDGSDENSFDRWKQRRSRLRFRGFSLLFAFLLVISLNKCGVLENEFRIEDVMSQEILSRLNGSIPMAYLTHEKKRPGFRLAEEGAQANYPIVMIPGFVTSGLEVWEGRECAKKFFRQRLWAALSGARTFLVERDCWREHMILDPITGGDPEGVKLRASQGFEAADYFLGNYWVWGKLIVNLADLGYTPSSMSMEAYDWRLSFPMLEKRDGYLTKLKFKIESMHKASGKKVVLASHSMGGLLVHYFFAWVTTSEKNGGGGGGRHWVDRHIHTYVNVAGSHLGVPKAATAILSGEMSDTIFTGAMGNMVEQFFGRRLRRELWSTWGSLWTMIPKGGNAIWGTGADMCPEGSGDDDFCPENDISPLLKINDDKEKDASIDHPLSGTSIEEEDLSMEGSYCDCPGVANCTMDVEIVENIAKDFVNGDSMTVEDIYKFLLEYCSGLGPHSAASKQLSLSGKERGSSRTWHDPTRTPLPHAPNMRIFCLYGVGLDTERAYYYRRNENEADMEEQETPETSIFLDSSVQSEDHAIEYGTKYVDGDGSVPLVSLGYMCADVWQRSETGLNPSGTKVITREYHHEAEFTVDDPMRAGPNSGEHVDILGNVDMTEDFLRIVSDFETEKIGQDRIVSDIKQIAARINSHPLGGVRVQTPFWKRWTHFLPSTKG